MTTGVCVWGGVSLLAFLEHLSSQPMLSILTRTVLQELCEVGSIAPMLFSGEKAEVQRG